MPILHKIKIFEKDKILIKRLPALEQFKGPVEKGQSFIGMIQLFDEIFTCIS
jgi:hypothetical protein